MTQHFFKTLMAWLFPHTCILCGHGAERLHDLCHACRDILPRAMHACLRCAIPMPESGICGLCLTTSPPFDITHALYLYAMPITKLILELKFNQKLVNARVLGELLSEKIMNTYMNTPLPECIIPMPLHVARLKERGFNQAMEIARPIALTTGLPIVWKNMVRIKATQPQAMLSAAERTKNIQDAFAITQPLAQKHVAVLDDVITTGNTIREFCSCLKQHGAQKIDVWCIARPDKIW